MMSSYLVLSPRYCQLRLHFPSPSLLLSTLFTLYGLLLLHVPRRFIVEGNAESLRLKSNLQKDFAAAVYLSEAPTPCLVVLGCSSNFVGSESGHKKNVTLVRGWGGTGNNAAEHILE